MDTDRIDHTLNATDSPGPGHGGEPRRSPRLSAAGWRYALRRAFSEFGTDGGADLAAMLTYYTVLSLAPALLAVFSIITLFLQSNAATVQTVVTDLVADFVPADYQAVVFDGVATLMGSATGGLVALTIGITASLWFASAYVKAFSRCMNKVYSREEGRGWVRQAVTMLLVTLLLLIGMVVILASLALDQALVSSVLGPLAEPLGLGGTLNFLTQTFLPVWTWVKWPVILVVLIMMIVVLYYATPNVQQPSFRWLSLGSVLAIIGITLAGTALSIYLTRLTGYSPYGAIGTVVAVLVALWVFNLALLFGAEVDAEIERARELEAGIPAERDIQLPPRDTVKVEKARQRQNRLEVDGRALRRGK